MEAIIQRKIEAIQQFMKPNPECDDSAINPVTNKHLELDIDILVLRGGAHQARDCLDGTIKSIIMVVVS